jgi:hypothetical protein
MVNELKEIAVVKNKPLSKSRQTIVDNVDNIIALIANNVSYKNIAERYGVFQSQIFAILDSDDKYRARKDEALKIASYHQIDEAKQYLESIQADDTNASVRKKCELSQFSTYLAKVKNRKEFDLNYKDDIKDTNQQIIVIPASFGK